MMLFFCFWTDDLTQTNESIRQLTPDIKLSHDLIVRWSNCRLFLDQFTIIIRDHDQE